MKKILINDAKSLGSFLLMLLLALPRGIVALWCWGEECPNCKSKWTMPREYSRNAGEHPHPEEPGSTIVLATPAQWHTTEKHCSKCNHTWDSRSQYVSRTYRRVWR